MRLGLTMRVLQETRYPEHRDALSHEWSVFMRDALPECAWLAVPNIGASAVSYFDGWQLDGLILTGGSDPQNGARAETEAALLRMALKRSAPVFGVCRGLQQLQIHFGGVLAPCSNELHAGRRHEVLFTTTAGLHGVEGARREVNSFHHWGIPSGALAASMRACALTADGWVEAACSDAHRVGGVMWHPERERPVHAHDIAIVRRFFGLPQHHESCVGL